MAIIKSTEDFRETNERSYPTLEEAINAYSKYVDWGTASWSRRVEILDDEGNRVAGKWFRAPVRKEWTLEQTVMRIRELGGDEAVDRYLDLQEPNVPWEYCIDCEKITPRNTETARCVYRSLHE